ncbi:MAG: hypothetical protein CM1200mP34_1300 [Verrucomicrobiales bacterium]|nr:MAG: hypothetical protein CM1200mP34_1300 [Verrucomicrobiales bacterium]
MVDWLTLVEIVQLIERHHPGLNKLLETASEQIAKNDPDKLDYLQQRVLIDALKASREQGWELEANGRLALTHLYHGAALSVFLLVFLGVFRHHRVANGSLSQGQCHGGAG